MKKNLQIIAWAVVLIASCINCSAQNFDKPLYMIGDGDTIKLFRYDARGNKVWERTRKEVMTYVYDNNGNMIEERVESSKGVRVNQWTVSWEGVTCKIVGSDGSVVEKTYTDNTYKHLAFENEYRDSDRDRTYKQYDEKGRLILIINYGRASTSDDWKAWLKSDFSYSNNTMKEKMEKDIDGNLSYAESITEYLPNGKYDKPLRSKNLTTGESFEAVYDNKGRLIRQTYSHGLVINYSWNGNVVTYEQYGHHYVIGF